MLQDTSQSMSFMDSKDELESEHPSQQKKQQEQMFDNEITKFYQLIDPTPIMKYCEHEYDIVDLSWQRRQDGQGGLLKS